ncbi:ATP-dependent DNA ligase [Patescibacteria group bacterium]|nr:ATP-dependent DNA ligase [Patescibacteria group bacterium]
MTFKKLATYFSQLEKTSSRLRITEILADLLKQTDQNETDKVCYLSLGRLGPLYAGIEFNLAEKMMLRVISQAYGISEEKAKKEYKKIGDLGEVAAKFDKREKPKPLTVNQVYERLEQIAQDSGEGSVERKISNLAGLLGDLDAESSKYIVRIPLGRLRLGFSDLTVLDAFSWMVAGDKSKRQEIEEAYNNRADVGQIAQIIKSKGLRGLRSLKVQLGVPIMPALCQRLPTAEEMVEKLGKMAVEPKYDGQRLQAHYGIKTRGVYLSHTGCVKIFTRNLENVTHMFPDIVEALGKEVKAKEVILDGEAIGFDPKTGKFLPFQETMKRKRKYEIRRKAKEIPLKFFCFDILYKDGRDLLKRPFNKRREILEKVLPSANKTVVLSPQIVTNNPQELRKYHDEQIKKGLEGVVVKKWQAPYDPGRRGYTWVKFKQEKGKKGGGLADTLDCVVMGYYKGKGKRAEFGIGAFLVGVRKEGQFLTISKIGTGLSDEQWREMYKRCEKVKTGEKPKQYQVAKDLTPDIWCQPKIVVEIEADNITKSPIHTAQYALRFPRLVRFRDDKSPEEATSLREAEKLYKLQK